jgi:hypothetical protein
VPRQQTGAHGFGFSYCSLPYVLVRGDPVTDCFSTNASLFPNSENRAFAPPDNFWLLPLDQTGPKVRQPPARQTRTGKSLRWKLQDMVAAHNFHHVVSDTQDDGGEILDVKRSPKHPFCWSATGLIIVRRKRFFCPVELYIRTDSAVHVVQKDTMMSLRPPLFFAATRVYFCARCQALCLTSP